MLAEAFKDGVYPRFRARLIDVDDSAMTARIGMPFQTVIRIWRHADRIEVRTTIYGRPALFILAVSSLVTVGSAVICHWALQGAWIGNSATLFFAISALLIAGYGKNVWLVRERVAAIARLHWIPVTAKNA